MGGGLTKEERKQVFYVFSKIDTSKAGHISIDNLKKYCTGWTKEGLLQVLKYACATKTGEISPGGFEQFCKSRVVYAWYLYDKEGSGSIDVENVKDVLYDMLKNAGDEEIDTIAQEKIKQWDTNSDGKVTLSDFTEYVIKSIAAEKDPWEFAQE